MKKSYFSLGLFLAIGLIVSTVILTDTYEDTRTLNTITVKGYAEMPIESDVAMWSVTVTAREMDLGTTTTMLGKDIEKVRSFINRYGFAAGEVDIMPVNTRYQYQTNNNGYNTNIITGTVATQTIKLKSVSVEKVKELSVAISELIREGIEIESYSPRYDYTKLNDIKMALLGQATDNAYKRAEVIAENGDSEVGKLKYASQGVFQITSSGSNEVSDYGIIDQSSINKLAKAVVTAEFAID